MAGLYMRDRRFARAVADLEPPWASTRRSLVRILRRLDEAGVVRPVLRVSLPEDFARFDRRYPYVSDDYFTSGQVEEFTAIGGALADIETLHTEALREQLEDDGSPLASYLVESSTGAAVRWDDWMVAVDETDSGRIIRRPHVVSVYGSWQKIQCWFAIESRSFRALLDPSQMEPEEVYKRDWNLSLGDQLLKCTVGSGRGLKVFEETNEQAWLRKLYLFREEIRQANHRLQRPHFAGWQEGQELSFEDRKSVVNSELAQQAEDLGGPWVAEKQDFCNKVSLLLEMVGHAEDLHSPALVDVIHEDLRTAVAWSYHLYKTDFWDLNEIVEPAGSYLRKTLNSELRPSWHEARRSAERFLRPLANNDDLHPQLSLSEESLAAFLDFLCDQGLESWMLELSQVNEEFARPTDASLDRRFLHLRSQAILTEAVVTSLAEQFGTDADRKNVHDRRTKWTYRAFLLSRPGWRTSVWQCLSERWDELTQAKDAQQLADNLDILLDGEPSLSDVAPEHDPVCRAILTSVAFRHYGAHHFTRDRTLLVRNLGRLMGSVAQTAIFYWNQATSDV